MTENDINISLEEFARKYLSPPLEERTEVSKRYNELIGYLPGNEIFQSGSYRRETSVTPVHDLDVIWVLPRTMQEKFIKAYSGNIYGNHFAFNPSEPLTALVKILSPKYSGVARVELQTHSVKIAFNNEKETKFSIDVVPAVPTGELNEFGKDIYFVPEIQKMGFHRRNDTYKSDTTHMSWIKSDPNGYIEESLKLNSNPSYRKAVKFVKIWRRICNASLLNFELKSFHVEMIMSEVFKINSKISTYDALYWFFSRLADWLEKPVIYDKANASQLIDSYLEDDIGHRMRKRIEISSKEALGKLVALKTCTNYESFLLSVRDMFVPTPPWMWPVSGPENISILCSMVPMEKKKNVSKGTAKGYNVSDYLLKNANSPKPIISGEAIYPDNYLHFRTGFTGLEYDTIKWLVVNTGREALEKGRIGAWRGDEFHDNSEGEQYRREHTEYPGNHWVSCYLLKEGTCIACGKFDVKIIDR